MTFRKGSGNLGPFLIKSLIKNNFTLTVLSRQSSDAVFDASIKVVKVSDSYPELELVPIFKDHDAVVVSISHLSNGAQIAMIDAAVKAKSSGSSHGNTVTLQRMKRLPTLIFARRIARRL
jgi:hypothetical protein